MPENTIQPTYRDGRRNVLVEMSVKSVIAASNFVKLVHNKPLSLDKVTSIKRYRSENLACICTFDTLQCELNKKCHDQHSSLLSAGNREFVSFQQLISAKGCLKKWLDLTALPRVKNLAQ